MSVCRIIQFQFQFLFAIDEVKIEGGYYGKSVVFQGLPTVFASVDRYEENIVILISPLINLMKDQVRRLSLLKDQFGGGG